MWSHCGWCGDGYGDASLSSVRLESPFGEGRGDGTLIVDDVGFSFADVEVGTCNTALLLALLVLSSIRLELVLLLEVLAVLDEDVEVVEAVEELVELELSNVSALPLLSLL
jgi:hypothetical protein